MEAGHGSRDGTAKRVLRTNPTPNSIHNGSEWFYGTPELGVKTTSHINDGKGMTQPQKRTRDGATKAPAAAKRNIAAKRNTRSDSDDSPSAGSPFHEDEAGTASGSGSQDRARAAAGEVGAAEASTAASGSPVSTGN